jgi:type I restriction enzyme, S subunit
MVKIMVSKGYKQSEMGIIPENWDVSTLEKETKMERGKFSHRPRDDPAFFDGKYPFIQTGDVEKSNGYIIDYSQTLNEKGLKVSRIFPSGIIVITIAATIGSTALTTFPVCFPDSLIGISTKKMNIQFLEYFLQTKKEFLNSVATLGAQKNINYDTLKPLLIPKPEIEEQNKITEVLNDIDDLIHNLNKLIDKKKKIKQGTMHLLLSGKKRLNGFNKKWKLEKLGNLLEYEQPTKFIVKKTDYNKNYPTPVLTAGKTFLLGFTNETNGIFNNLPVIIFDDFTTASKFVTFPFKVKSSAMKILKQKNQNFNLKFLFEKIQSIKFEVGNHKRHWISQFQFLEVLLPDIDEQNIIEKTLTDMDNQINNLKIQKDKYIMIKKGMMQKLLTGKIRLK